MIGSSTYFWSHFLSTVVESVVAVILNGTHQIPFIVWSTTIFREFHWFKIRESQSKPKARVSVLFHMTNFNQ